MCATVGVVQGRPHSLSDHGAFHLALIACACVLMVLLSVGSPAQPEGTDWLTRQIDGRVELTEPSNHTAVPMPPLDIRFAEGIDEERNELFEATDDDETAHALLRLDIAALESQTGLYESSADRAPTPFRLRVFSSRGSPSV